jgi:hypothetical protein
VTTLLKDVIQELSRCPLRRAIFCLQTGNRLPVQRIVLSVPRTGIICDTDEHTTHDSRGLDRGTRFIK